MYVSICCSVNHALILSQDNYITRDPHDSLMALLFDECDFLDRVGFKAFDAAKAEHVHLHVKVLAFMSDLRGLQDFMKAGGSPSTHGCLRCWFKMLMKAGGKTLYVGLAPFLPVPHPLRVLLKNLHKASAEEPRGQQDAPSSTHLRTHYELRARLVKPDDDKGPLGPLFSGMHEITIFRCLHANKLVCVIHHLRYVTNASRATRLGG